MIASFHCVNYRRPVLAPPRRVASGSESPLFWRPLNIGGDFAYFRTHPNRRALYPRLRPDFHRWAFYAVWEDESALDAFLQHSAVGESWRNGAIEAWHLWMRPEHVRGSWAGMRVMADGVPYVRRDDGPVAEIVRVELSLRGTLAMWGWAAPHVLAHVPDERALLLGLPLVDRPYTRPVSFSLWRSSRAAQAFAYGSSGHREAIERVRRVQGDLMHRHSAGRFKPYRSAGTWLGRNPLAAAEPQAPPVTLRVDGRPQVIPPT